MPATWGKFAKMNKFIFSDVDRAVETLRKGEQEGTIEFQDGEVCPINRDL